MKKKTINKNQVIEILKIFLSAILIIVIIFTIGFVLKVGYDKIHKQNLNNINWLRKNISLKKDTSLGNNIYSVNKASDINIYNMKYQKVINEEVNELLSKKYTFDDMFMVYNLYGTNEQSLNIYFTSEEKSSLSYTVCVDDKKISDFTRTLNNGEENNLTTNHSYQIIGLVPGYENTITFTLKDGDSKVIAVKKISINMKSMKSASEVILEMKEGTSKEKLENGLYAILGNDSDEKDYVFLYDNDGIIRSQIPIIGYRAHALLFRNRKMYYSISQTKIAEVNYLGEVENIYKTGKYNLHHDYTFDNDGNLLILANNTEKDTEEDCIIKIDLETEKVTEVIDFEDIFSSYVKTCKLDTTSVRDEGEDGLDWLHLNSIEYVDGDVILSSRETSSIIKVSSIENNPKIEYIIADKKLWKDTSFESYVYKKIGDFKIHAGQHSVRYQASNEDGIYYLTFFDNNYGKANSRPKFDYNTIGISNDNAFVGDKSYYYVYKVDEKNKTFELVDSFNVEYSGIVSSVQVMNNGNIVIDSGTKGLFAEYDSNHNLIKSFKTNLNKYMVYRVLKYDFNDFWFSK